MNLYRSLAWLGTLVGVMVAHLDSAHAVCADPPCIPDPPPPPVCGPFDRHASESATWGDRAVLGAGFSVSVGVSGARGVVRNTTQFNAFADAFGTRSTLASFNLQGIGGTTHGGSVDLMAGGATVLSLAAPVNTSVTKALHFFDASANYSVMAWFVPVSFSAQISLDGQIGLNVAELADATHVAGSVHPNAGISSMAKAAICLGGCTSTGLGVGVNGSLQLLSVAMPITANATLTGPTSASAVDGLSVIGSAMSGRIGYSVFGCLLGTCGTFASGDIASWPGFPFAIGIAGGPPTTFCL